VKSNIFVDGEFCVGSHGGEMKRTVTLLTLILILPHLQVARGQNHSGIVLPNPKLLRCNSSDCFQLWSEATEQKGIFPKQMIVDMDQGCIYGMTALYDKSVSLDEIVSAIDDRYKHWTVNGMSHPFLHVWRVEDQKFSIQLTLASKEDEKRNAAEAGTRQAIYIAFGGKSACGTP
jgi:hypothetical protein